MNRIGSEFLRIVDRIAAAMTLPDVRALLLPVARSGIDAEFCAVELEDGSFGFSYVWLGDTLAELRQREFGTALAGMATVELARWVVDPEPTRRALGYAAINAMSQSLFRRAGYLPGGAADSIGLLHSSAADHIGMIGLFPPLLDRILGSGARLTVAELRPELATDNGRYRVTLDIGELATCNKVISTSTILLNDTLDAVLAACRNASYFAIIGPTAGCVPDPLFARGVDLIGGTRVVDAGGFREAMRCGQPWGRHAQKYCIRSVEYPGLDALLGRVPPRA